MILQRLKLIQFRNLQGDYSFSRGINLIIAPNGQGKTNFLEAINFLSSGKSFRTNQELSCIQSNIRSSESTAFTRLEGSIDDALGNSTNVAVVIEQAMYGGNDSLRKTLKINNNKKYLSKFIGKFYTVVFSPNTIDLVSGTPSVRRKDLDDFLCLYDETYVQEITDYRKVVRSRNKLLEEGGTPGELSYWNRSLVELGSTIIYKRARFLDKINPTLKNFATELYNHKGEELSDLQVVYESKYLSDSIDHKGIRASFTKKIQQNEQKERRAGITLYGPHREDFLFMLNGKSLREFGSRGEQRLCSFLYKIAQWEALKEKIQSCPVLLLDDLFSELDQHVCMRIQKFLLSLDGQTFLTSLGKSDLDAELIKKAKQIIF